MRIEGEWRERQKQRVEMGKTKTNRGIKESIGSERVIGK